MNQAEFDISNRALDENSVVEKASSASLENREGVWIRIQDAIKQKLGVERFGLWFKKTKLMKLNESTLVVGVPNVIIKQYLEQKYKTSVFEIARELTGKEYEVRFDIAPSLFRRSRDEHEPVRQSCAAAPGKESASDRAAAAGAEKVSVHRRGNRGEEEQFWGARHSFERLIATESNRLPFLAAQEMGCKKNPRFEFLLILGQSGFGKTALLEAIAHGAKYCGIAKKAVCEMAEKWCNEYYYALQKRQTRKFRNYYRTADILLLDGIEFLQGKPAAQDELLFTIKTLHNNGARVALSCSCHPNELKEIKHETHNLLKGAFWAELVMPPACERIHMVKQLADLHTVRINPDVCKYLSNTFKSSIQELNASVATIATYASLHREQRVDLDIAFRALSASARTTPKVISVDDICNKAAAANAIKNEDLRGSSRARNVCRARHMAVLLARNLTDLSLSDIGRFFGGRSHSTIKHSISKARKLETESKSFSDTLNKVRKLLDA